VREKENSPAERLRFQIPNEAADDQKIFCI
jgi:hypothetical protein